MNFSPVVVILSFVFCALAPPPDIKTVYFEEFLRFWVAFYWFWTFLGVFAPPRNPQKLKIPSEAHDNNVQIKEYLQEFL